MATATANRALVLTFTAADFGTDQFVYVFAVDDQRSEGDRVVAVQHSVLSADARFDGIAVRNVEVTVRDNDTPGVVLTQVQPGTTVEDRRTVVIEGSVDTRLDDEILLQ